MSAISASKIACCGLGVPDQTGLPTTKEVTVCAACGVTIQPGETVVTWAPSKGTFTDYQYLVSQHKRVCQHCAAVVTNAILMKTQMAVINEKGAWQLSKDAHRIWLFLTPPAPPFVAVISDSMKQHLIWRARVTMDLNLIHVRLGMSDLSIRRPLLLEAVKWCQQAADIARSHQLKVTPDHPFNSLDRKRADLRHAVVRNDIQKLALSLAAHGAPDLQNLLQQLNTLGEGELWALSALAKAKKEAPLPELVQFFA